MDFTGKRNEQLELVEEGEDNLLEIAEKVFNRPPGPSNSIQLELSDDTVNSSSDKTKLVGDIMMCIMLHGIRILYTEEERKQLNEQQFDRVREYMRSFGYDPIKEVKVNEEGMVTNLKIYFKQVPV